MSMQSESHPKGFDYKTGSPHLKHEALRRRLLEQLANLVRDQLAKNGSCSVLEIGAGHGDFTDYFVSLGATVTLTEMSQGAVTALNERFHSTPNVKVVFDEDGTAITRLPEKFNVIACISVLHHIPDYLSFIEQATLLSEPGGSLITWQDPVWYARRRQASRSIERLGYIFWRLTQGNLRQAARTGKRRLVGRLDPSLNEDMVEYHVVRQGVDEIALSQKLANIFADVEVQYYWSSQNLPFFAIGRLLRLKSTFSIVAQERSVP